MKDRGIDNAIENVNNDKKEGMRAQLYARVGIEEQREQQTKSLPRFLNVKSLVFGLTGILAVCLAIVLPITLLDKAVPPPSQSRYTYTYSNLSKYNLGLTIKEYAEQNGADILYIDWYEKTDECVTTKYFLPDDEDNIIYITEDLTSGETGDNVWLAVTDLNINVDVLDLVEEMSILSYEYNDIIIKWSYAYMAIATAYFEFNGYKYYIQLREPLAEQDILNIATAMLK